MEALENALTADVKAIVSESTSKANGTTPLVYYTPVKGRVSMTDPWTGTVTVSSEVPLQFEFNY
jgi:hypothetical protein